MTGSPDCPGCVGGLVAAWALTGALAALLTQHVTRREEPSAPPRWHVSGQVLVTAAVFAALAWRLGPGPEVLAPSWLAATGVGLAAADLRTRRLPNRLVLPGYLAVPGLAAVPVLVGADPGALVRGGLGLAALLAFHGLLATAFPGQLGGGDVKLAGPVGFLLAWHSWTALLAATGLTWVLAALALPLSARARAGDRSLPLGPFLLGATLAAVLLVPGQPGPAAGR